VVRQGKIKKEERREYYYSPQGKGRYSSTKKKKKKSVKTATSIDDQAAWEATTREASQPGRMTINQKRGGQAILNPKKKAVEGTEKKGGPPS